MIEKKYIFQYTVIDACYDTIFIIKYKDTK